MAPARAPKQFTLPIHSPQGEIRGEIAPSQARPEANMNYWSTLILEY